MSAASRILARRKEAKDSLNYIFNNSKYCLLIHYSCESFYENQDGHSPRVTSIAIRNLHSGQTKSFSIHQYAESNGINLTEIPNNYDCLEKKMLSDFYLYVDKNSNMKWIHWNMRDVNYGFEAIAHRFRVLGGNPIEIPTGNLIDLARILISLYTPKYIGHPRLEKLIELNKITKLGFLSGGDEAKAFEEGEYVKLHQSTLRKVDIFSNLLGRIEDNTLVVRSTSYDMLKVYPQLWLEKIKDHWVIALLAIIVSVVTFFGYVTNLFSQLLQK